MAMTKLVRPLTPFWQQMRVRLGAIVPVALAPLVLSCVMATGCLAEDAVPDIVLKGQQAFGDWHSDHPGTRRHIAPADLPKPYATRSAGNPPAVAPAPTGAMPKVPAGFTVTRFTTELEDPRLIRIAPNGDIFVAETENGRIRVLRAAEGAAKPDKVEVFAKDLDAPFGIAFYPLGPDPKWVYVANTNAVVRFPYASGDLRARGAPQTVIAEIASRGGHTTRDIAFSKDGKRLYLSVGSGSNVAQDMPRKDREALRRWQDTHALGASWGRETDRADVLVFDPEGKERRVYASGIRNCVGLALQPTSDAVWCSTNERDGLGDNLVPDYVTHVEEGGFYGWPWLYIGDHQDPRHEDARPDLAGHTSVPDVLIQPHSAPLQIAFYDAPKGAAASFPSSYEGDAFVALHGSWNRAKRTGYKVVRVRLADGKPTGEYDDFLTGFVLDDGNVWGRPVGVAVAHDGALLVAEDGNSTLWRIAYTGQHAAR